MKLSKSFNFGCNCWAEQHCTSHLMSLSRLLWTFTSWITSPLECDVTWNMCYSVNEWDFDMQLLEDLQILQPAFRAWAFPTFEERNQRHIIFNWAWWILSHPPPPFSPKQLSIVCYPCVQLSYYVQMVLQLLICPPITAHLFFVGLLTWIFNGCKPLLVVMSCTFFFFWVFRKPLSEQNRKYRCFNWNMCYSLWIVENIVLSNVNVVRLIP